MSTGSSCACQCQCNFHSSTTVETTQLGQRQLRDPPPLLSQLHQERSEPEMVDVSALDGSSSDDEPPPSVPLSKRARARSTTPPRTRVGAGEARGSRQPEPETAHPCGLAATCTRSQIEREIGVAAVHADVYFFSRSSSISASSRWRAMPFGSVSQCGRTWPRLQRKALRQHRNR